ncbi:MAG: sugar phosphate isomerase/epimerase [Clostridiales bacterium]|nr:sugar phosphate isomerase/epimerase [Clostridiales bacterium]
MRIGCAASAADIDVVSKAGFDYIELSARHVLGLDSAAFKALADKLERIGLPCAGFNSYCPPRIKMAGPGFSLPEAEAYAKDVLMAARALGAQHVGVGSPMSRILPEGYPKDLANREIREFFLATANVFAERGIYVLVEPLGPCYCNFINTISEAAGIVADIAHPFLALLPDFYNMERSGEGDKDLTSYQTMICHTHISDDAGSALKRDFLLEERYPLHKTRIQNLASTGYDRSISIEIDMPAELQKAESNLEFLRKICCPQAKVS